MADTKTTKPYGDVKYADPGYRDGTKRYPIDTEAHVRAAWSYINMPKNASKYDSKQLAAIKGRIKAAARKLGIKISDEDRLYRDILGVWESLEEIPMFPT